jgi:hypothetical protein
MCGGCRDDRIKVLMSWPPDFGSDVEIPLNNGRDGVGDGPDIFVRCENCRLAISTISCKKDVTSPTSVQTAAKLLDAF